MEFEDLEKPKSRNENYAYFIAGKLTGNEVSLDSNNNIDLSNYYTKEEVDNKLANVSTSEQSKVIYSTEEKEIGIWTDGSKLFEKTIVYNEALPNGDIDNPMFLDFDFDMTTVKNVIKLEGIISSNISVNVLPYSSFASSQGKTYVANLNISKVSNKIRLYTTMNLSTYTSLFITVRYTKKATE